MISEQFLIVCKTPMLGGEIMLVDRECESWFERDTKVQGVVCQWIFPKEAWINQNELAI